MANDFMTIADMLADAFDLAPHELSEIRDSAPLMSRLPVIASSNGDTHKYAVNTVNPTVGFRSENVGREFDSSEHRIDTVTLKILDFSWMVDKAVADRWRQGGRSAFIAREGLTHLRAALYAMEVQFLNGTLNGGSAAGFTGLANSSFVDGAGDDMTIDAGNAAANTGASAYLLRVSPSEVANVAQGDGIVLGDTIVQNFVSSGTLNLPTYYTPATTWVAGQLGAKYSVARIINLKDDDTNGLTDDLLYNAMKAFPAGMGPNLVITNQTQLERLRRSRTATNPTGSPAPTPSQTGNGVSIITTDALVHTEAIIV